MYILLGDGVELVWFALIVRFCALKVTLEALFLAGEGAAIIPPPGVPSKICEALEPLAPPANDTGMEINCWLPLATKKECHDKKRCLAIKHVTLFS